MPLNPQSVRRTQRAKLGELMAKSVNKVILVGNVGKAPEVKYTPSGTALAKFSIATNDSRTNQESGRAVRSGTTFWRGSAWPRSSGNMSARAPRFTSRADCKPPVGKIAGAEKRSTAPK